MARRVNMHLDEEFADEIERHKPKSLALAAFCALLIEQALDNSAAPPLQPPVRGANKSSSASVDADESELPAVGGRGGPGGELPPELEPHRSLIADFWRVKKGSKGETAWKLLLTELGKIRSVHGDAVVVEQLQLAVNGKFQSVTLRNYERFSAPAGNTPRQPEFKHPAAREFRNGRFVDEDGPTTNPVLKDLF